MTAFTIKYCQMDLEITGSINNGLFYIDRVAMKNSIDVDESSNLAEMFEKLPLFDQFYEKAFEGFKRAEGW